MAVVNSIVPGKVVNNGIRDRSIPNYVPVDPSHPLHLPVVSIITPMGELASESGTTWIATKDIGRVLGDIFDPKSPYYNPSSVLLSKLAEGGQASVGVRRLAANNKVSRVPMSAFVQKVQVKDYERDLGGNFKRDAEGNKIPTATTYEGLKVVIKADPEAADSLPGDLVPRTIAEVPEAGLEPAIPATYVYPLFEAICGVGDEYNNNGLKMGVSPGASRGREEFINETGAFPFELSTFVEDKNGVRLSTKTALGADKVSFTLFETELRNVKYSLKHAFGEFTGTNVNRPVTPRPAPFKEVIVYQDNITSLCQLMYSVESQHNTSLFDTGAENFKQMNPFTCTDHNGAPYFAVVGDDVITWDMTGSVKAQHGISPFLNNDGELPDYVTPHTPFDPMGLLDGVKFDITPAQAWEANNALIVSDLKSYILGSEPKNYTINRQSLFWDVGYAQEVKDVVTDLLSTRKDIYVMACATVYDGGRINDPTEVYSRHTNLVNKLRLYPESEKWGTQTCRASVNLIQSRIVDEATGGYFSGNIDLAYAYALVAGNQSGTINAAYAPDSGINRELRISHSPLVEFEDDPIAGINFDNGGITLRPKDVGVFFRPALITVYKNPDSVLKDAFTVFLCICIEKILQDEWNNLSGDTTITADNYVALMKDNGGRKCRDKLGGLVQGIEVEPSFSEGGVGSRAIMNTIVHAYFNKGKYMMNLDLFAYNEEDM